MKGRELYKYEACGDSVLFFLKLTIDRITPEKREDFKSEIIKGLEKYAFIERSKEDPEHPESMRNRKKIPWPELDHDNPEDSARAIIQILHPYYVSDTQNRVKKYIENNL